MRCGLPPPAPAMRKMPPPVPPPCDAHHTFSKSQNDSDCPGGGLPVNRPEK
jgi:hypothetical protein